MSTAAVSPYDGNIQFAWDSTSLGWLKDCPRKYFYHQIEGWRAKSENVALTFGQFYHQALELWDRLLIDGVDKTHALREVIGITLVNSYGWNSDDTKRNRETLIRSIVWYLDEFATDPLKTVTLENGKPAVELSFRMELDWGPPGGPPYLLCGHLDRIVEFGGGQYVTDRKTTSHTIGSDYFGRFDLDNQMSLYTIAANVVFHTPVKGIIIDGAQIAVGFTRFARGMTYRTPAQTQEWLNDLIFWLRQAETYAAANYWPMNERSCMLCSFKRVCSQDPSVRQMFLESDFERRPWNPLEIR
ncbi:MAG TPA: PD-(D/E)XK nuclease family protein [Scandinavium sp.]|jgi:hypothetical protein|uniref:PD-(D/E)XK nuclease family protein n=1 Tax=Scandinavium sp. TaxID=2830653 RepID=UPI002E310843|nr:PD-(D/E)XK nuclease family protein [Scandinavium sp.]HEX4500600.1 PD-(D/E)XK nuclease family protein [Scandinavium sp.]